MISIPFLNCIESVLSVNVQTTSIQGINQVLYEKKVWSVKVDNPCDFIDINIGNYIYNKAFTRQKAET